jgi:hypothetical protein
MDAAEYPCDLSFSGLIHRSVLPIELSRGSGKHALALSSSRIADDRLLAMAYFFSIPGGPLGAIFVRLT